VKENKMNFEKLVVISPVFAITELEKAIATEWLTNKLKTKPSPTSQSTGKVFVILVTNQINECQQC